MTEIAHKLIMLKPMQTGVSGYARLQAERGRGLAQINARGLSCAALRAFWYAGDGWVKELGTVPVNPKGEAAMEAELPWARYAPERLQALLLVTGGDAPKPLLIGLCASQSAGSLLDAKNASLSLCERLRRESALPIQAEAVPTPTAAPSSPPPAQPFPVDPAPIAAAPMKEEHEKKAPESAFQERPAPLRPDAPPREIFLPAIDPLPYIQAETERPANGEFSMGAERPAIAVPLPEPARAAEAPPPRQGVPVDLPPVLRWPKAFAGLQEYFERLPPCRVLPLPGWRFVCVSRQEDGLWIGYAQQDGAVRRVAYAMRGEPKRDDGRPYQRMTGVDGAPYRVLIQRV